MFKLFKRWWSYTTARLTGDFNSKADPKIQLKQAVDESKAQHARLKDQAASVIATHSHTQMKLDKAMDEYDRVVDNTRQAIVMADQATQDGDSVKADEFASTAELFATKMVSLETEVEDLRELVLQSATASDQAKVAVQQNGKNLQKQLGEQRKLLSQIDQAAMQETMNTAMASLSETVGQDVPSFDEIREKVELRYAKAKGVSELTESSVSGRMMEVERAAMSMDAQNRLSDIRAQLGLSEAPSLTENKADVMLGEGKSDEADLVAETAVQEGIAETA